jgi:hypothetical protein
MELIVDMPYRVRFAHLLLFTFFVLFTNHIHLKLLRLVRFPITSTVNLHPDFTKGETLQKTQGESRALWQFLFRRDSLSSASTSASGIDSSSSSPPSPQFRPRKCRLLHRVTPDSYCVASSPADSEFNYDDPICVTISNFYEFGSHLCRHGPFHH